VSTTVATKESRKAVLRPGQVGRSGSKFGKSAKITPSDLLLGMSGS